MDVDASPTGDANKLTAATCNTVSTVGQTLAPGVGAGLDRVVRHRRDNTPVTAARAVLDAAQMALTLDDVARVGGVHPDTLKGWLAESAQASKDRARGANLTATQRRLIEFADELGRRMGATRGAVIGGIQRIGIGGYDRQQTRTKETPVFDADGNQVGTNVEVTTTTEVADGDWRALAWIAERTYADTFARRQAIEVSGPGGGPIEVASPRERLMERLGDLRRRAIETSATEPMGNGAHDASVVGNGSDLPGETPDGEP